MPAVTGGGRILVVDDSLVSRMVLVRALEAQGHTTLQATNGREAIEVLRVGGGDQPASDGTVADVVLLDLLMPELDGYATLAAIKGDEDLSHVPVIVVSGDDDLESVVRCIEMGATDFLRKPFNRAILAARINASLAEKRLRDLELVYLEQVEHVIDAAGALEAGEFDPASLAGVAARDDELGRLARTFSRMASEVKAREDRLRAEVMELRIEIDEARQARQVAEITGSDYFRDLRARAKELRRTVDE